MATVFILSGTSWSQATDGSAITAECIGAGGGGMNGQGTQSLGAGGGGYSQQTGISYTSGASLTVQIGAGGSGTTTGVTTGGDTWFNGTSLAGSSCGAKGGGATGGAAASGVGSTKFSGGTVADNGSGASGGSGAGGPNGNGGAAGHNNNPNAGGGGGNGGGTAGSDGPATGTTGGAGGNNSSGSGGGTGVAGASGNAGTNGGGGAGGGGGGTSGSNGGAGGNGIEWDATHGSGGGGGAGGNGSGGSSGGAGGSYGGGGGGGGLGPNGGNGAPGIIRVTYSISGTTGGQIVKIFLTSGTSWTVPSDFDFNSATVEVVGAGGKGSARVSTSRGGSGGGGGGYARATGAQLASLGLTRGGTVSYQIGSGSTQTQTWFSSSGFLFANAGATGTTSVAGAGGTAGGTGAAASYSGGSGFLPASGSTSGAGGGSAGPHGAGSSATGTTTGGAADAGNTTGGGANTAGVAGTQFDATHGCGSGAGGSTSGVGKVGGNYGGGNSGNNSGTTSTPPNAAGGLIVITYTSDINMNVGLSIPAYASGTYAAGNRLTNAGNAYECITAGTLTAAPTGTGASISPGGTSAWKFLARIDFTSIQTAHDSGIPTTLTAPVVIQAVRSDKNRTTADIQLTSGSNSAFSFSGKTTSATNTITVRPFPGDGFADALRADNTKALAFNAANGFAILCPSDAASFANFIYIGENYVTLKGLQIQDPLTTSGSTIIFGPNSNITVDSCIVDGTAQSGGANTVVLSGGAGAFINSLFIDHQGATDGISACQLQGTGGGKAINCTWYNPNNTTGNAVIGNTIGETYTVRNCITVGFQQSIIDNSAAVNIDHCQTDQTSFSTISTGESVGAGCSYSVSGSSQFVTPGSNFRLKSTSPAISAGATDTTDIPTSVDIMGQTRTVPWDIGAAEYVVTATSYTVTGAGVTATAGFVGKTAAEQLVSASTTSAAGALITQAQETLVDTAATSTAGTVSKTTAEQFTGTAATASAGLAGTALVQQTAITGATAASASGIVNKTAAEQFVGASSSALTGSAAFIAGEQLLGAGVAVSAGAINKQAADQSAASATAQVGIVSFAPQIALAGAAATTSAGLVTAFLQRALTGASATSFAGSPLLGRGAAVTGVEAGSAAGTVGLEADELALSAHAQAQSGEYGLTRASTATYIGPDVIMHDAQVNELRYTYDGSGNITGPLLEPASTNYVRDAEGVGANPGVSWPTGWGPASAGGLTVSLVGYSQVNGFQCLDIHVYGTATDAQLTLNLSFDNVSLPCGVGQTLGASCWGGLLSGTLPGVARAYIQTTGAPHYIPGTNLPTDGSFARSTLTYTITDPAVTGAQIHLWVSNVTAGTVVDYTIRVAAPQLEFNNVTSYIRTAGTVATRAADIITGGPLIQPPPLSAASTSLAGIVGKQPSEQLTSASVTATTGTIASLAQIGLPAAAANAQAGFVLPGYAIGIVGAGVISQAGTLQFIAAGILPGAAATAAAGIIALQIARQLVGTGVISRAGLITPQVFRQAAAAVQAFAGSASALYGPVLPGAAATAAAGFPTPSIAVPVGVTLNPFTSDFTIDFGPGPGQPLGGGIVPAAIAQAGVVVGVPGQTVPLIGAAGISHAGSVFVATTRAITGAQARASASNAPGLPLIAPTGVQLQAIANSPVLRVEEQPAGAQAAAIAGALLFAEQIAAAGLGAIAQAGTLAGFLTGLPVIGAWVQGQAGLLLPAAAVSGPPAAATAQANIIPPASGQGIPGATATAYAGTLQPGVGIFVGTGAASHAGQITATTLRLISGPFVTARATAPVPTARPSASAAAFTASGLIVPNVALPLIDTHGKAYAGDVSTTGTLGSLFGAEADSAAGPIVPQAATVTLTTPLVAFAGQAGGILSPPAEPGPAAVTAASVGLPVLQIISAAGAVRADAGDVIAGSGFAQQLPSAHVTATAHLPVPLITATGGAQVRADAGSFQYDFTATLPGAGVAAIAGRLRAVPIYVLTSEVSVSFDPDDRLIYFPPDDRLIYYGS